jgi:hypothetical protein
LARLRYVNLSSSRLEAYQGHDNEGISQGREKREELKGHLNSTQYKMEVNIHIDQKDIGHCPCGAKPPHFIAELHKNRGIQQI